MKFTGPVGRLGWLTEPRIQIIFVGFYILLRSGLAGSGQSQLQRRRRHTSRNRIGRGRAWLENRPGMPIAETIMTDEQTEKLIAAIEGLQTSVSQVAKEVSELRSDLATLLYR